MSQSLELNIKTNSDVPQAVDKARSAIESLEKRASASKAGPVANAAEQAATKSSSVFGNQFEKIGKSFGNTISSVFLSFAGPMALLSGAISLIQGALERAAQIAANGIKRLEEGNTDLATQDEIKMANFFKMKTEREKEQKEVAAGKAEIARRFLEETEEGRRITRERGRGRALRPGDEAAAIAGEADIQKIALEAFLKSDEGKKYAKIFETQKSASDSFKAPEGFSNVVGVGANPVLQAMDEALSESKKQTSLLEDIASGGKKGFYPDFTKQDIDAKVTVASFSNL